MYAPDRDDDLRSSSKKLKLLRRPKSVAVGGRAEVPTTTATTPAASMGSRRPPGTPFLCAVGCRQAVELLRLVFHDCFVEDSFDTPMRFLLGNAALFTCYARRISTSASTSRPTYGTQCCRCKTCHAVPVREQWTGDDTAMPDTDWRSADAVVICFLIRDAILICETCAQAKVCLPLLRS